jgi:energy-coupling factor transporter ATP-binding protein EcfA2
MAADPSQSTSSSSPSDGPRKRAARTIEPDQKANLSPSVQTAISHIPANEKVSAWAIVLELLRIHPEYGQKLASTILLSQDRGPVIQDTKRTAAEWVEEIASLIEDGELNGRYVIYGLAILDNSLYRFLSANSFLEALREEITPRYPKYLSRKGVQLEQSLQKGSIDAVPMQPDGPAAQDRLQRQAFVDVLAKIVRDARAQQSIDTAFLVHLHGPWGSGKSTLLRLLKDVLRKHSRESAPWLVVEFNAWQNQRFTPPFWPLMRSILAQSQNHLRCSTRGLERLRGWWLSTTDAFWRLTVGRLPQLLMFIVFLALTGIFIGAFPHSLQDLARHAQNIKVLVSLAGAVWTGLLAFTHPPLTGSAASARSFIDSAKDPFLKIKRHFTRQVAAFCRPVVVLIDDLDRCEKDYVIGVLEGIQTLMRDTRITYVVAADRRWLCTCFDSKYSEFGKEVNEPGRPLGYLFLEKTFQVSASVPRIDDTARSQYWDYLIGVEANSSGASSDAGRRALQVMESADTEEEILAVLNGSNLRPNDLQSLKVAAIGRLLSEKLAIATEHRLQRFSELVEPNPRAMKRFVNAYYIQRASNLLAGGRVSPELLALWTILLLRWPVVGEFLQRHPEQVDLLAEPLKEPLPDITRLFPRLIEDTDFLRVLRGIGTVSLTRQTIMDCIGLRASSTSGPAVA